MQTQQLPQFYKGCAEILEHIIDLVRRQSLGHLVFVGHGQDLAQTLGISKKTISGRVILHNCLSL